MLSLGHGVCAGKLRLLMILPFGNKFYFKPKCKADSMQEEVKPLRVGLKLTNTIEDARQAVVS